MLLPLLARQAAPLGLAVIGQSLVMRGRSIDLSSGGVIVAPEGYYRRCWEVCRRLREKGHTELPIIIVSANVFDPTARQSESMYCNDFIAKPFMLADLLSKLKLHLGIEWTSATPAQPSPAQAVRLIPPRPVLSKFMALGDIGYVKGIMTELDALEKKSPMYAPFCAELRSLVERFRLPEYNNRLKEWMYDDVDHV
mgnify:CR=1 FL=1